MKTVHTARHWVLARPQVGSEGQVGSEEAEAKGRHSAQSRVCGKGHRGRRAPAKEPHIMDA